jgi:hypothetical protein
MFVWCLKAVHSLIYSSAYLVIHSSIHSVFCHTTDPKPLSKRVFHRLRSSASSFNIRYSPISLGSSNSCLRLHPRIPVTSILPSIFPSITCNRKEFLRNIWPIQLAYLLFIVCRSVQLSFFYPSAPTDFTVSAP